MQAVGTTDYQQDISLIMTGRLHSMEVRPAATHARLPSCCQMFGQGKYFVADGTSAGTDENGQIDV